jgi:hypothetical protein
MSIEDHKAISVHESEDGRRHEAVLTEDGTGKKEYSGADLKMSPDGIVLIPQPSDDPDDPLVSLLIPLRILILTRVTLRIGRDGESILL